MMQLIKNSGKKNKSKRRVWGQWREGRTTPRVRRGDEEKPWRHGWGGARDPSLRLPMISAIAVTLIGNPPSLNQSIVAPEFPMGTSAWRLTLELGPPSSAPSVIIPSLWWRSNFVQHSRFLSELIEVNDKRHVESSSALHNAVPLVGQCSCGSASRLEQEDERCIMTGW